MRAKKALINIISSFLLQVVTIICGFIIPRLVIETYGSEINGLIVSITQFLSFITLLEAGFGPVIKSILYKPIANKDKLTIEKILRASEKIFRIISYIFICYIIVLSIALPFVVSNEFDKLFTISLIIIISISTFAEYYFGMTYKLYLQADQKKYITSAIQIGTLIFNAFSIFILIKLDASIQIVKLVSSFIFVLRPILQNIYVKKKYNINLKEVKDDYKIKQKWDGLAQHIAYVIHTNTDIAILTVCTNVVEVSVYSVYLLVVKGVKNLVESVTGGIDATFGEMYAKGEKENLNKNFKTYEGLYLTIASIVFISTLFLIIPFVSVYTNGIKDADYIRPVFAYLMVLAEFICIIRLPYSDLVKISGHFKETRKGAIVEAVSNIAISLTLVWKFGIVGVAIGTLVAMLIRTIDFMYHTSKYILDRSFWYCFKRLIVIAVEVLVIILIINVIPKFSITGYIEWLVYGIVVFAISFVVITLVNMICYKENVRNVYNSVKNIFNR